MTMFLYDNPWERFRTVGCVPTPTCVSCFAKRGAFFTPATNSHTLQTTQALKRGVGVGSYPIHCFTFTTRKPLLVLGTCAAHRDGWDQVRPAGGSQSYEPRRRLCGPFERGVMGPCGGKYHHVHYRVCLHSRESEAVTCSSHLYVCTSTKTVCVTHFFPDLFDHADAGCLWESFPSHPTDAHNLSQQSILADCESKLPSRMKCHFIDVQLPFPSPHPIRVWDIRKVDIVCPGARVDPDITRISKVDVVCTLHWRWAVCVFW